MLFNAFGIILGFLNNALGPFNIILGFFGLGSTANVGKPLESIANDNIAANFFNSTVSKS